jgi:hypothetical protein
MKMLLYDGKKIEKKNDNDNILEEIKGGGESVIFVYEVK